MKKYKDIDLAGLKHCSRKLSQKVKEHGFIPDHILYVERVGLLVGYEIAKSFNCSISGIYSSRSGGALKSKFKIILRFLPRPVTHFLRGLEIKSNIHDVKKDRNVYVEGRYPPKDKKILLVDDALDTGHSIKAVLDYLINKGYSKQNIKTAVLTTTHDNSVCQPDISLFENIVCTYPWSYDSKEYKKAWKLYSVLKSPAIND